MTIETQVNEAIGFALSLLKNVAAAALVIVVGRFIAAAARRQTRRTLERPDIARALGPSIVRLLSSAVYFVLLVLAAAVGLIVLGVPTTAVVAVLAAAVVLLAIALQQSVANFAATISFLMFEPFRRGELILTMGHTGTVEEILLFDTVLRLGDARLVALPNSKIHEDGIVNYSRVGYLRADVSLTISYSEAVDHARALITEIATADARVLADPPFAIVVDDLGENGVRLLVFPYVLADDYGAVRNDLRERIKARFDEVGIRFGLPERTIRFPSGTHAEVSARDSSGANSSAR